MNIQKVILSFSVLMMGFATSAQIIDPVHWEFTTKKTGDNTYAFYATATMDDPWHIYSQYTDDGGPLPTTFSYEDNPDMTLKGKPGEKGALMEKYEEVFMVDTRYYPDSVDFVQKVEKKKAGPVTLKGSVTFMACTDEQCLTPREVEFKVLLK